MAGVTFEVEDGEGGGGGGYDRGSPGLSRMIFPKNAQWETIFCSVLWEKKDGCGEVEQVTQRGVALIPWLTDPRGVSLFEEKKTSQSLLREKNPVTIPPPPRGGSAQPGQGNFHVKKKPSKITGASGPLFVQAPLPEGGLSHKTSQSLSKNPVSPRLPPPGRGRPRTKLRYGGHNRSSHCQPESLKGRSVQY